MLTTSFPSFSVIQGCTTVNPGSFVNTDFSFWMYYPGRTLLDPANTQANYITVPAEEWPGLYETRVEPGQIRD